jgi:hypothetical protein
MTYTQMTARPATEPAERIETRWVEVTDERGRTRMEARWITVGPSVAAQHAA